MTASKTRTRHERRDRRKAKASEWAREGNVNPRKVGHANYDALSGQGRVKAKVTKQAGKHTTKVVYSDGELGTSLGDALREALNG